MIVVQSYHILAFNRTFHSGFIGNKILVSWQEFCPASHMVIPAKQLGVAFLES